VDQLVLERRRLPRLEGAVLVFQVWPPSPPLTSAPPCLPRPLVWARSATCISRRRRQVPSGSS
jgi:hypothetical protein